MMVLGDGMQVENRLAEQIERTIEMIDKQISVIEKEAETLKIDPYELKHTDGTYVLERLVTARAFALQGLVHSRPSLIIKTPNDLTDEEKRSIIRRSRKDG